MSIISQNVSLLPYLLQGAGNFLTAAGSSILSTLPSDFFVLSGDMGRQLLAVVPPLAFGMSRFRTAIALNISLRVDPLNEEELMRQIMAGDVSQVPVEKRDVLWRLQVYVGDLIRQHREEREMTLKKLASQVEELGSADLSCMENARMWGTKYYPGLEKVFDLEPGFFMNVIKAGEGEAIREEKMERAVEMIIGNELKRLRMEKNWSRQQLAEKSGCTEWNIEYAEQGHYFSKETKKWYRDFAKALDLRSEYFEELVEQHLARLSKSAPSERGKDWNPMLRDIEERIGEPIQAIHPTENKSIWTIVTETGKAFRVEIAISELVKE